jgi:hypothetical protein
VQQNNLLFRFGNKISLHFTFSEIVFRSLYDVLYVGYNRNWIEQTFSIIPSLAQLIYIDCRCPIYGTMIKGARYLQKPKPLDAPNPSIVDAKTHSKKPLLQLWYSINSCLSGVRSVEVCLFHGFILGILGSSFFCFSLSLSLLPKCQNGYRL